MIKRVMAGGDTVSFLSICRGCTGHECTGGEGENRGWSTGTGPGAGAKEQGRGLGVGFSGRTESETGAKPGGMFSQGRHWTRGKVLLPDTGEPKSRRRSQKTMTSLSKCRPDQHFLHLTFQESLLSVSHFGARRTFAGKAGELFIMLLNVEQPTGHTAPSNSPHHYCKGKGWGSAKSGDTVAAR